MIKQNTILRIFKYNTGKNANISMDGFMRAIIALTYLLQDKFYNHIDDIIEGIYVPYKVYNCTLFVNDIKKYT